MSSSNSTRPSALVTGASSGLGEAFARRLAHDGYDLIIVARREDKLEALAKELQDQTSVSVDVFSADLSNPGDLRRVEERMANDPMLAMLVNNAGFGAYMPFVELGPDRAEALICVQVIAVTRLTHAALPGMIERGRGDIINVSSRLAYSGALNIPRLPKRATYAGTKAFANTFSQLLAGELEGTGVRVQALCPGVIDTDFHEAMGMHVQYPPEIVMSPENVVKASLVGLQLGEVICIPGMHDPALLEQVEQSTRQLWERTSTGSLADRYVKHRAD